MTQTTTTNTAKAETKDTPEMIALKAQLAALQAENAKLKARETEGITMKVSEKGALSIYGMGRFPVTLYPNQWEHVFSLKERIEAFIAENKSKFKTKEQVREEQAREKAANEELERKARIANAGVTTDSMGRTVTTGSTQRLG